MTEIELDPKLLATLQTLESQAVEYVLVGEVADAIHDGGGFISGVAIVPAAYGRNVDRLAFALKRLDAHHANGQPVDPRTNDLRALAPCTFTTAHAKVELDFAPGGTNGYPDLFDDAARIGLAAGVNPHVASPQDLDRIDGSARGAQGLPPAVPPATLPPEPDSFEADEVPVARGPQTIPLDPADWPQEIRASRATRR
ncbi:hypothetical protein BH20ACT17_BH20ACT17_14100 [soil metagenome]